MLAFNAKASLWKLNEKRKMNRIKKIPYSYLFRKKDNVT
jgi:hypothetical protein